MDSRLILVKTITLLYLEGITESTRDGSGEIVRAVVQTIKLPELSMDGDKTRDVISALRTTALWMSGNPQGHVYDKTELLQRIRVNAGDDTFIYDAFVDGIGGDITVEQAARLVSNHRRELLEYMDSGRLKDIIRQASSRILFNSDSNGLSDTVKELVTALEPLAGARNGSGDSMVQSLMFSDEEGTEGVLVEAEEELNGEGGFKLGIQALNRMTGAELMKLRYGEMVCVYALQHNFKTGMLLTLFKHMCLYNTPVLRNPKKKPLLVFISLENEIRTNVLWLYKNLIENETGEVCDTKKINPKKAAAFIKSRLEATGFSVYMGRADPSDFTYYELFETIKHFESEGYEIKGLVVDYTNMMSKKGCTEGPMGHNIRDLFRRIRNFTSPRGITYVTAHQLSTEAKKNLLRHGVAEGDFVREINGKGYTDGCSSIDNEMDLELYQHIERVNGEAWLTIQRGKHRKVGITPEKHQYTVLKFHDVGDIRDDINGPDSSYTHIGGKPSSEGGGKAWYA